MLTEADAGRPLYLDSEFKFLRSSCECRGVGRRALREIPSPQDPGATNMEDFNVEASITTSTILGVA